MAKITVNQHGIGDKMERFFRNMAPDFKRVGEVGAEAIIRTTLAGIGEADQPFAPYSPRYLEQIDAVGGKPQNTVNLRGLFYPPGTAPDLSKLSKRKRNAIFKRGGGRRAFLGVSFVFKSKGGGLGGIRSFTGMTKLTRPQLGLTDPLSEMSLDLITVSATANTLRIVYNVRKTPYMIYHQEGAGRNPRRPWFSANKAAVAAAMGEALKVLLAARVQRWNAGRA
jgi:hypothetical protein